MPGDQVQLSFSVFIDIQVHKTSHGGDYYDYEIDGVRSQIAHFDTRQEAEAYKQSVSPNLAAEREGLLREALELGGKPNTEIVAGVSGVWQERRTWDTVKTKIEAHLAAVTPAAPSEGEEG